MTKSTTNYLPTPVLSFNIADVGESLVEKGMESAERFAPSHFKVSQFMKKCLPMFALLTFMGGSAFLGVSILVVPDQCIGYYTPSKSCQDCTIQLYVTGTYLSFPWSKGMFKIVNVANKNLTIGIVDGFKGTCIVECNVFNVSDYVHSFHKFGENSVEKIDDLLIGFARTVFKNMTTMGTTHRRYGVQIQNAIEVSV